jgi:hypothetical protein
LQELYALSTSNAYSLPFPLKSLETNSTANKVQKETNLQPSCSPSPHFAYTFNIESKPSPENHKVKQKSFSSAVNRNLFGTYCAKGDGGIASKQPYRSYPLTLPQAPLVTVAAIHEFPLFTGSSYKQKPRRSYTYLSDIQSEIPWNVFQVKYGNKVDNYNDYISSGEYGVRVAVHAHHFSFAQRPPAAPTPVCVDGMLSNSSDGVPKWSLSSDRLTFLFKRLVGVTGFNPAMVMTSKSPLSMFHAFISSHYALHIGPVKSTTSLLRNCVKWLLVATNSEEQCTLVEQSKHSVRTDALSVLCVWCEAMGCDKSLDEREKLRKMQKHINDVSFLYGASYVSHFPKLNRLFLCVLSRVYNVVITVFDNMSGTIHTYQNSKIGSPHILLFHVGESEYFGVFDLDVHV